MDVRAIYGTGEDRFMSADEPRMTGTFHMLNEALEPSNVGRVCPNCGKDHWHWHVENYDEVWRDGDVVCVCGTRVRSYDAG